MCGVDKSLQPKPLCFYLGHLFGCSASPWVELPVCPSYHQWPNAPWQLRSWSHLCQAPTHPNPQLTKACRHSLWGLVDYIHYQAVWGVTRLLQTCVGTPSNLDGCLISDWYGSKWLELRHSALSTPGMQEYMLGSYIYTRVWESYVCMLSTCVSVLCVVCIGQLSYCTQLGVFDISLLQRIGPY